MPINRPFQCAGMNRHEAEEEESLRDATHKSTKTSVPSRAIFRSESLLPIAADSTASHSDGHSPSLMQRSHLGNAIRLTGFAIAGGDRRSGVVFRR
jgi:hypothetical protein